MEDVSETGAIVNANASNIGRLIAKGYEPIPVRGKKPVADDWTDGKITSERFAAELAAHPDATGIGLRAGRLVPVDVDLEDPTHSEALQSLAAEMLAHPDCVRIGRKGAVLLYRNETPIGKITIRGTPPGKGRAQPLIEILGTGQQFVAYGIHPDTGRAYEWPNSFMEMEPRTWPMRLLSTVTPAQLRAFARKAAELLAEHGYADVRVSGPGFENERKEASPSKGEPVRFAHLRELLTYADPDTDRDEWRNVVAGLRGCNVADAGTDAVRDLACQWSRGELGDKGTPSRYTGDADVLAVWESMPPKPNGVGYGTVFEAARRGVYKGPPAGKSAAEIWSTLGEQTAAGEASKPAGKRSRFHPLTEKEMDALPAPVWLVPNLIQDRTLGMITGETGSYKSFVALEVALAVATGKETFGVQPVQGPVVYAALEGLRGVMDERRKAWRLARGIDGLIEGFYAMPAPTVNVPEDCAEFIEQIKKHCVRPHLIVLETLTKMLGGLDEDSSASATLVDAFGRSLIEAFGCAVVVVHHKSDKPGATDSRGSSGYKANSDMFATVKAHKSTMTAEVLVTKHKDAPEWTAPIVLKGRQVGPSLVFQPITSAEHRDLVEAKDRYSKASVASALKKLGAYGQVAGVTTYILATALVPQERDQGTKEYDATIKTVMNRLNERAKPGRELEGYGFPNMGPRNTTRWFLPIEAK